MTIEQKAKAYDEALEKARQLCAYPTTKPFINDLQDLFPELKESEDEKERKRIIALVNAHGQGMYKGDMLAWIEKQGEIDKESYEIAEKEKREFVGDGFIKCYADFQDFKEGKTYWLEYLGNDDYNVRSDNLLGKTYHITPCQLYTIFKKLTWLEKQGDKDSQIKLPTFTFDDILALQCCMETAKKVQNDKDLYEKLNDLHGRIYDAYYLEKQGDTNETINKDEFAQGVLKGAAINLITWIDYNAAEGNMCLSNMECKDVEDALVSGDWNKIYAYIKKKLEKQYEYNPYSGTSFKYNGHIWGMCARDHGVDIACDSKLINHVALEQEISNESGDANNGPVGYGKFIDEKLNEASKRYFADNSDPEKYSLADVFYAGIRCERAMKTTSLVISIRDRELLDTLIEDYSDRSLWAESASYWDEDTENIILDWLKSIKQRIGG